MALAGNTDKEKLEDLSRRTYKEQSVWYLNGFWSKGADANAERVWKYAHDAAKLDEKGLQGGELDEFQAHRFLEQNNETLTVIQMREHLRKVGVDKVRQVPFVHFLIYRYQVDWHELIHSPQGAEEEIRKAEQLLKEVQALFEAAKAAEDELQAALRDLERQEDEKNQRTRELQARSTQGGLVQQNKAKAELAQHLAEDPLPLRRAKITTEAATKKAARAREAAEEKLGEAERYLDEVKSRPGSAQGTLWWIDRELHEAKAYMPTSKGGYKKEK